MHRRQRDLAQPQGKESEGGTPDTGHSARDKSTGEAGAPSCRHCEINCVPLRTCLALQITNLNKHQAGINNEIKELKAISNEYNDKIVRQQPLRATNLAMKISSHSAGVLVGRRSVPHPDCEAGERQAQKSNSAITRENQEGTSLGWLSALG
jgi:hypothetical protein|eukprot:SAG25_NODE_1096_length_4023_cov_2.568552_2_plen_152_part_00